MFSNQAETELQRATMDATRTTKQLEETIDEFEKQKIQDIKVCCSLLSAQTPPPPLRSLSPHCLCSRCSYDSAINEEVIVSLREYV